MQGMKTLKKYLCPMLLGATLALLPPGCSQRPSQIAFFLYDEGDTFISEMAAKMKSRLPSGVSAEVRNAGNSQSIQNQQIFELSTSGTKLFVINAVDRLACNSIVEKCAREGIDVIFFNREPLPDALHGNNVFYVGADADSLGRKQAEMVAELFGDRFPEGRFDKNNDGIVQLAILKGEQGHQDAEKRTDNCVSRLKELGYEVEVLAVESADWSRANAYDVMGRLYSQYGAELELLYSNNDDMALGAIDYMLELGVFAESTSAYSQPFMVVGVDGTEVGLDAINRGLLYGTIQNDSGLQADAIITLADYIMNGKDMADYPYTITNGNYIYIDGESITRKNISSFVQ